LTISVIYLLTKKSLFIFNLIGKCYKPSSVIVLSNLSFSEWLGAFAYDVALFGGVLFGMFLHPFHIVRISGEIHQLKCKSVTLILSNNIASRVMLSNNGMV
jgi:DNA replication protein DnaC